MYKKPFNKKAENLLARLDSGKARMEWLPNYVCFSLLYAAPKTCLLFQASIKRKKKEIFIAFVYAYVFQHSILREMNKYKSLK